MKLPEGMSAPALDAVVSGEAASPAIIRVPIEQQNVEEVQVSRTTDSYMAIRRFRVQPPGEARSIVCDIYDETRNNLVEAKGTGTRGELRMAIGQLMDYGRFRTPAPALAVLTPTRPRPDLEALLKAAGVAAVWPDGDGFADNPDGRFS